MCGVAGTIYSKEFKKGDHISVRELEETLARVEKREQKAAGLLNQCWQYKSNTNLLRYCRDKEERISLEQISQKIKTLSENRLSEKYNEAEYEQLMDSHWFLGREIPGLLEKIQYFTGNITLSLEDAPILFYKNLVSVINAIDNRLEIRGRDSFGLAIQLYSKHFTPPSETATISPDQSTSIYYEEGREGNIYTFVFKTANSIGSLGDNAEKIRVLIKRNELLRRLIVGNETEFGTIVAHTRWASVGEINNTNCHPITNRHDLDPKTPPLILAVLNGDIYNYKEILADRAEGRSLDKKCTTDCLAIPISLTQRSLLTLEVIKESFKKYTGSFVIAVQASEMPGEVILSAKGNQGLYLGFSSDHVMFASDVYGLVETCRYFTPVPSGSILSLSPKTTTYGDDFECVLESLDATKTTSLTKNDLRTTNITTRDLDRRGYTHFLEKEIHETKDIVRRTLQAYCKTSDTITVKESQVPSRIIENLKKGRIKKIVITGMGTCYTASVAIAMYMRNKLQHSLEDIEVEPHVASEGSAFYLAPDMSDTLVIVVAQSGTTVDTNVYAKMAKARGAATLAIANKREGDVTFIVDGTLYLGNGRDMEIAVPSTKTYTAHVLAGYILTLYFCQSLKNEAGREGAGDRDLELLGKVPRIIEDTFERLKDERVFQKIWDYAPRWNSWYVAYDDSPNSVCAMEIRIKYSEACYHCLPYLTLDDILKSNVQNSFITYMTDKKPVEIEKNLMRLVERRNALVVILPDEKLTDNLHRMKTENKMDFIPIPSVDPPFSFLPTVIAGQLLSYHAAVVLDQRKKYFADLIESVEHSASIDEKWNELTAAAKAGQFNQGFSTTQFSHLNSLHQEFTKNRNKDFVRQKFLNYLEELYQFARRPVDTIKHQAKTITVGAVRKASAKPAVQTDVAESIFHGKGPELPEIHSLLSSLHSFADADLTEKIHPFKKILVCPMDIDEAHGYTIVSFLNEISHMFHLGRLFKLAQSYDLLSDNKGGEVFWIFLKDRASQWKPPLELKKNQYVCFDFSPSSGGTSIKGIPNFSSHNNKTLHHVLGSLYVAVVMAQSYCTLNHSEKKWEVFLTKEMGELGRAWDYVIHSSDLKDKMGDAARIFLTRNNWKCLGSGVNYNVAKFAAKQLITFLGKSTAFDVLENHKHIDMSAEGALLVFTANIWRGGYQEDVLSEVIKFVSHNNLPVIITNLGDKRFDAMNIPVLSIPLVSELLTFPISALVVDQFTKELCTP